MAWLLFLEQLLASQLLLASLHLLVFLLEYIRFLLRRCCFDVHDVPVVSPAAVDAAVAYIRLVLWLHSLEPLLLLLSLMLLRSLL